MIWNPDVETMPRDRLRLLQSDRLRSLVSRLYERVPFYRGRLDQAGAKPEDVKSLDDLRNLPFTRKSDLRDHYPIGLFAEPLDEIVRIHASSGTKGKPTVVGYTRDDLAMWAEAMARCFGCAGIGPRDVLHNAY